MRAASRPRGARRAPAASCSASCARPPVSSVLVVGVVSASDRAAGGVYRDEGIPALKEWLGEARVAPCVRYEERLIPDEQPVIEAALVDLVDARGCHLVLTTGGTGPAPRDVAPGGPPPVA